ncbi:protein of unknown function [Candidatus Methylacidiphilum fumarolicum]|uniref:Uncharacterized protein n=1 Tax=Candidatus Methylacidiphilum fumarolicum TaxID=591154 RepID=A0ABM9ICE7_9BACT|nr:protein of unknown function [Candidatus Methylacidiphilum fumarolicum]
MYHEVSMELKGLRLAQNLRLKPNNQSIQSGRKIIEFTWVRENIYYVLKRV